METTNQTSTLDRELNDVISSPVRGANRRDFQSMAQPLSGLMADLKKASFPQQESPARTVDKLSQPVDSHKPISEPVKMSSPQNSNTRSPMDLASMLDGKGESNGNQASYIQHVREAALTGQGSESKTKETAGKNPIRITGVLTIRNDGTAQIDADGGVPINE